jgi:hypothetical protein
MNCRPGDLAIVIGEDLGCECNIGALVRVLAPTPGTDPGYWGFEDASRPLKMADVDNRTAAVWVRSSYHPKCAWIGIKDCYLLPIRDPGDDTVDATLKLREATA